MILLAWMINLTEVADMMTKILPRKGLLSKLIKALTNIDRDDLSGLWRGVRF
jgi:hypothetical protein